MLGRGLSLSQLSRVHLGQHVIGSPSRLLGDKWETTTPVHIHNFESVINKKINIFDWWEENKVPEDRQLFDLNFEYTCMFCGIHSVKQLLKMSFCIVSSRSFRAVVSTESGFYIKFVHFLWLTVSDGATPQQITADNTAHITTTDIR